MGAMTAEPLPAKISVLGVGISLLDMDRAIAALDRCIAEGRTEYVCVTGVHGVIESQSNPDLMAIHNAAGLVVPDGMPVVWMARALSKQPVGRVCGFDLTPAFVAHSVDKGYRHFFYGGAPGVPEQLRDRLVSRYPGLQVVGTISPPFRLPTPEEDAEMVAAINAARPDVVWVGLSTPKQERWMAAHRGRLNAAVLIGVGAAFDVEAGLKRRAPGWTHGMGLEWLYRLLAEPRRLWRRYAVIVPTFLVLSTWQLIKAGIGRKY